MKTSYFVNGFLGAGLFGLMLVVGCSDMAHDNPLDPDSPDYSGLGSVYGKVLSYSVPHTPIPEVVVTLSPSLKVGVTDEDGEYRIDDVPVGSYWVLASRTGYCPDSLQITVSAGKTTQDTFYLDALPVFLETGVASIHISTWISLDDIYEAEFQARVTDPDGVNDIDSVFVRVDGIGLEVPLGMNMDGYFQTTLNAQDLPHRSLEDLLGQPVIFLARDQVGHYTLSDPMYLVRIIEETPRTISPNQDTVGTQPLLVWEPLYLPYDFSYTVEVYQDIGLGYLWVWGTDNIPSSVDTIRVTQSLQSGFFHYWVVWVVDGFGDRSRSKEAAFNVEEKK
ncbi:carboxypeptidase regulatory-like domain-containing protein [candidate division KSB1 bacterium]|nr:carboxypeptidase regulatory-like domain-containing protein [candidate division KSB1 bacterium]